MKTWNKIKRYVLSLIDNLQFIISAASSIANADTGYVRLFVDSADGLFKYKTSNGTVVTVGSLTDKVNNLQFKICAASSVSNADTGYLNYFVDTANGCLSSKDHSGNVKILIPVNAFGTEGQILYCSGSPLAPVFLDLLVTPAQIDAGSGTDGQFLKIDGELPSWSDIAVDADQINGGTDGQVLTSDGSKGGWETLSVTPAEIAGGTDGQVLTSDGSKGGWETLSITPAEIAGGTDGQVLTSDGSKGGWEELPTT